MFGSFNKEKCAISANLSKFQTGCFTSNKNLLLHKENFQKYKSRCLSEWVNLMEVSPTLIYSGRGNDLETLLGATSMTSILLSTTY